MKITPRTFQILKNFSTINPTLFVAKGNKVRTISTNKTIMAEAVVQEEFPREFCIYDLSEFLGVCSLFENPDFDFDTYYVKITDDASASSHYFYAEKSMVTVPPDKELVLPDEPINFTLGDKVLKHISQAAGVMKLPEIVVQGDGSNVRLVTTNTKNTTSHEFAYDVGKTDKRFKMVFNVDNLKLISGTYDVTISSKKMSKFVLSDGSLSYFIANEGSSSYGGE